MKLVWALLLVVLALGLAACGETPGPKGDSGPPGPPGERGEAGPAGPFGPAEAAGGTIAPNVPGLQVTVGPTVVVTGARDTQAFRFADGRIAVDAGAGQSAWS